MRWKKISRKQIYESNQFIARTQFLTTPISYRTEVPSRINKGKIQNTSKQCLKEEAYNPSDFLPFYRVLNMVESCSLKIIHDDKGIYALGVHVNRLRTSIVNSQYTDNYMLVSVIRGKKAYNQI